MPTWIGNAHTAADIDLDAPTMITWEHESGIPGGWDSTCAPDPVTRARIRD
jgi:hypothetical protein